VIGPSGDHGAALWRSVDGREWAAVALDPPGAAGPGYQSMTAVAGGPLGFLAAAVDRGLPVVWWSGDGTAWSRVQGPFLDEHAITGVAVGRAGMVAVGTIRTGGNVDGMAWFSADGSAWRTVPLGSAGFTGPGQQAVRAVTATGAGFVAVGHDEHGPRRAGVVWTSADGITWQRLPPAGGMAPPIGEGATDGTSVRAVAGAGPVVALGHNGRQFLMWSSPDGRRWTGEESPAPRRAFEAAGLVATDGRSTLLDGGGAGLWFRPPGARWVEVGDNPNVFPRPVRTYGLRSMIHSPAGFMAVQSGDDQAIWRSEDGVTWRHRQGSTSDFDPGRVFGLTTFGDLAVAVGVAVEPRNVAAVWISADGGDTWERTDAGNPGFSVRPTTQMVGVTAGGPGVVAVGLGWDDHTIDAMAWVSADGRTWRRATEPPAWSGPGDEQLTNACPLPGGGVVALGTVGLQGDDDVWAWVSGDGMTWEQATGPGAAVLGGPGAQLLGSCATTSSQVLVAGAVPGAGGFDGVLWATSDGKTWRTVGGPDTFAGPTDDRLVAIAAEGDRLAVTGLEEGDVTVRTSADGGATWTRHRAAGFGGVDPQFAGRVAIAGDRVVLTGYDGASAAVWIGPAPVSRR
jgi:hypothetical protein